MTDLREQLRTYFDAVLDERAVAPSADAFPVSRVDGARGRGRKVVALAAALAVIAGGVSAVVALRSRDPRRVHTPGQSTTTPTTTALPDRGAVVVRTDGSIDLVNADRPGDVRALAPAGTVRHSDTEFAPGVGLSPDGATLVYGTIGADAQSMIVIRPAAGHDGPTVSFPGGKPALSPDGRRLAYTVAAVVLVLRDLADGSDRRWTGPPLHYDESCGCTTGSVVGAPHWAPDSRHVLTDFSDTGARVRTSSVVDVDSAGGPLRNARAVPGEHANWGISSFWGGDETLLAQRSGATAPGTRGGTIEIVTIDPSKAGPDAVLFTIPAGPDDRPPVFLAGDTTGTRVLVALQGFPASETGPRPPASVHVWSAATGLRRIATDVRAASWWERLPEP